MKAIYRENNVDVGALSQPASVRHVPDVVQGLHFVPEKPGIASVAITVNGVRKVENAAPFAAGGDVNGVLNRFFKPGAYAIKATAHALADAGGAAVETVTLYVECQTPGLPVVNPLPPPAPVMTDVLTIEVPTDSRAVNAAGEVVAAGSGTLRIQAPLPPKP